MNKTLFSSMLRSHLMMHLLVLPESIVCTRLIVPNYTRMIIYSRIKSNPSIIQWKIVKYLQQIILVRLIQINIIGLCSVTKNEHNLDLLYSATLLNSLMLVNDEISIQHSLHHIRCPNFNQTCFESATEIYCTKCLSSCYQTFTYKYHVLQA